MTFSSLVGSDGRCRRCGHPADGARRGVRAACLDFLTTEEAAAMLGISESALFDLIEDEVVLPDAQGEHRGLTWPLLSRQALDEGLARIAAKKRGPVSGVLDAAAE